MPRILRELEDNGYYHILTRGNDRKKIFRQPKDCARFLYLVNEIIKKHPIVIYHYCLMKNHVHFLVKTLKAEDLPKFFQILLQRYAHYFRERYGHAGYLFQNRYKSYPITKESYLLECARYIERNPVRANFVTYPGDYRWSSFSLYAHGEKNDIIKEEDPLYLQLSEIASERQRLYKEYLLQERAYEHVIDQGLRIT